MIRKTITTIITMSVLVGMLGIVFNATQVSATPGSMQAYWRFDAEMGSIAYDTSELTNDGTLSGGKFGNALSFDGVDDYVNCGNDASMDITSKLTIEAWINRPNFDTHGTIVGKTNGNSVTAGYGLFSYKGGVEFCFYSAGGWRRTSPRVAITANEWHHIVGTFDGNYLYLYVDGVQKASLQYSGTIAIATGYSLHIAYWRPGLPTYFDGLIDEIRISNTVIYTNSFTPQPSEFSNDGTTVALWHFDDGTGTVASDASSNSNDGTISGATWIGPTWVVDGKYGKALDFDGVDDYVEVPDSASLDITTEITIEAWIIADVIDTYKSIVVKGDAYVEGKINYGLQIQSEVKPGTLRFFVFDGSYHWVDSTSQVPADGNWHHIAVTVDNTNAVKIYIDGTPSGTGILDLGPVSDSPLDIGRHKHYTLGPSQYWAGNIDEVRIWNRALTASQVEFAKDGKMEILERAGLVIYTSGFHGLTDGETVTIEIVPDTVTTIIESTSIHRITPLRKQTTEATAIIEEYGPDDTTIRVTVTHGTPACKTIHLWLDLNTDGHIERIRVNLHFARNNS